VSSEGPSGTGGTLARPVRRVPRLSHSVRVGVSFGLTSGIITTLGLLVGLSEGTNSKTAVLAGILTIALADSLSDALGIHMSEESEGVHRPSEVWTSTFTTFAAKLVMALTFVVPVAVLPLDTATIVAVIWGAVALIVLSISQARGRGVDPTPVVFEHLVAGILVVVASYFVGMWISAVF
jgi:VIT1/CCC1 family predicted Fe2+/Mn2+ transporter